MSSGSKLPAPAHDSDSSDSASPLAIKICRSCKKKVISPVTCHFCRHFYHPSCVRVTKVPLNGKLRTKCSICSFADVVDRPCSVSSTDSQSRPKDPATATPPAFESVIAAVETSPDSYNARIAEVRAELNSKIDGLLTTVEGLEASTKSQTDQRSEFKAILDELAALPAQMKNLTENMEGLSRSTSGLVADLAAKVERLTSENRLLATQVEEARSLSAHAAEVTTLRDRVVSLERGSLSCDLILTAVPEMEGEDLPAILRSIATRLDVNMSSADLVKLVRLKSTVVTDKPRLILAKLGSIQCRNRFLAAKREKGSIYADEIGLPGDEPHTPIFINEHLPPLLSKFLGKVRSYAKARGFRFVWIKQDWVYVKRDASSEPIIIKSEADLHLLTTAA